MEGRDGLGLARRRDAYLFRSERPLGRLEGGVISVVIIDYYFIGICFHLVIVFTIPFEIRDIIIFFLIIIVFCIIIIIIVTIIITTIIVTIIISTIIEYYY